MDLMQAEIDFLDFLVPIFNVLFNRTKNGLVFELLGFNQVLVGSFHIQTFIG